MVVEERQRGELCSSVFVLKGEARKIQKEDVVIHGHVDGPFAATRRNVTIRR